MEESEGLAYDNPHSSFDATVMGVDSLPRPQLSSHDKSANSLPNTLRGFGPSLTGVAHGANATTGARSHHPSVWHAHSCGPHAPGGAG